LAGFYTARKSSTRRSKPAAARGDRAEQSRGLLHDLDLLLDKAYRDFRLKEPEKKEFVLKGIEQVDKALQLKPDYMEALTYKNLLLRLQANLEKDQAKQSALLKEADKLRDQAMELQKKQAAGIK